MSGRLVVLGSMVAALFASACSSASPAADTPESRSAPRVLVDAILFDVPSEQTPVLGSADPTKSLYDLATHAGASHITSPHALAADGALTRMSLPAPPPPQEDALEAAFASYRLDVTPHVVEPGRVHLDVDFNVAGEDAKAAFVVDDKQRIVLATTVVVNARRFVLVLQPNIVRSDADLRAVIDDLSAQRDARMRGR